MHFLHIILYITVFFTFATIKGCPSPPNIRKPHGPGARMLISCVSIEFLQGAKQHLLKAKLHAL